MDDDEMKESLLAAIRKLISPSIRYEIRNTATWWRDILGRACFWRWEIARFKLQKESPYEILYIGRKKQRAMAKLLIGGKSPGIPPWSTANRNLQRRIMW